MRPPHPRQPPSLLGGGAHAHPSGSEGWRTHTPNSGLEGGGCIPRIPDETRVTPWKGGACMPQLASDSSCPCARDKSDVRPRNNFPHESFKLLTSAGWTFSRPRSVSTRSAIKSLSCTTLASTSTFEGRGKVCQMHESERGWTQCRIETQIWKRGSR